MRGTLLYVGQRLILIAITTILVSSIVFLLLHQIPGNAFLNETRQSPQTLAAELHHYGLDLPLHTQYLNWVAGVLHGDLGESLVNRGVKITPLLLHETSVSATVGFFALLVTIGLGLLIFGHYFYIWTQGTVFYSPGFTSPLTQVEVPALALGLPYASYVARLTRASMLETIRTDYVRTAWAKGLKARVVVLRHALRNALIPVVTILGPLITGIITGSVVIENIFGIPGLGKEFVTSILARDYNIVIGVFTFYAALVGLANLTVDVIYPVLDPRIRY